MRDVRERCEEELSIIEDSYRILFTKTNTDFYDKYGFLSTSNV